MGNETSSIVLAMQEGTDRHEIDFDADLTGSIKDLKSKCKEELDIAFNDMKVVIKGIEYGTEKDSTKLNSLQVSAGSEVTLMITSQAAGGQGAAAAGMKYMPNLKKKPRTKRRLAAVTTS